MKTTYDPNWNQASYPETERLDPNAALIPDEWGGYGRPAPPLGRIIRERDYGEKCHVCGSSLKKKWFRRTDKCIHPGCSNYFNRIDDVFEVISDTIARHWGGE